MVDQVADAAVEEEEKKEMKMVAGFRARCRAGRVLSVHYRASSVKAWQPLHMQAGQAPHPLSLTRAQLFHMNLLAPEILN